MTSRRFRIVAAVLLSVLAAGTAALVLARSPGASHRPGGPIIGGARRLGPLTHGRIRFALNLRLRERALRGYLQPREPVRPRQRQRRSFRDALWRERCSARAATARSTELRYRDRARISAAHRDAGQLECGPVAERVLAALRSLRASEWPALLRPAKSATYPGDARALHQRARRSVQPAVSGCRHTRERSDPRADGKGL